MKSGGIFGAYDIFSQVLTMGHLQQKSPLFFKNEEQRENRIAFIAVRLEVSVAWKFFCCLPGT